MYSAGGEYLLCVFDQIVQCWKRTDFVLWNRMYSAVGATDCVLWNRMYFAGGLLIVRCGTECTVLGGTTDCVLWNRMYIAGGF
jgi:hypothetical protein